MRREEFDSYSNADRYIKMLSKMHDDLILATMPDADTERFEFKDSAELIKAFIKREIRSIESYQESL